MKRKNNAFPAFYHLLFIGITAVIICAFGLIYEISIYRHGGAYYAELSGAIETSGTANESPINTAGENQYGITPMQIDSSSTEPLRIDFIALRENIPDIVAWIRCPGTVINYPVVQGTDNAYYLNHLPDGTGNKTGSIFLDYNNSKTFSDYNSVVYGHHIRSGDMFAVLDSYKDQQFYDEHPVIELYTPDGDYLLELFAGYMADARYETIPLFFGDTYTFTQFIEEIRMRSFFQSSVILNEDDRVISLCTCTYSYSDERIIIIAKITEAENKIN